MVRRATDSVRTPRGRPTGWRDRHVADDILRAADKFLADRPPSALSLKDIADEASINSAMIAYYFGSKDGLLAELIDQQCRSIRTGAEALRAQMAAGELDDPARAVIHFMAASYRDRPSLNRILTHELQQAKSGVRRHFNRNWVNPIKPLLHEALAAGVQGGRYRADLDIGRTVELVRSMVFFPLMMQACMAPGDAVFDFAPDWLDSVCDMLDRACRA